MIKRADHDLDPASDDGCDQRERRYALNNYSHADGIKTGFLRLNPP